MTVVLTLDAEQAAILEVGMNAVLGMMNARIARADPDKVLSNSLGLQAKKMQQVSHQMHRSRLASYAETDDRSKKAVRDLAKVFTEAEDPRLAAAAFERLRAAIFACRIFIADGEPDVSTDLSAQLQMPGV